MEESNDHIANSSTVVGVENEHLPNSKEHLEEKERIARVNAVWEQMNVRVPAKLPKTCKNKPNTMKSPIQKRPPDWMVTLGMLPKKTLKNRNEGVSKKGPACSSEETKKLAAAALSAVRNATAVSASGKGKIEISEVREFAGKDIEVKKIVDVDSKEAVEKTRSMGGSSSALDSVLEQIKKKPKLSVLDKTKKDWGGYKVENNVEEELDAYKKSSNQYLDKVSFLHRTDLREFERERDVRLASNNAKRRPDMREDDV